MGYDGSDLSSRMEFTDGSIKPSESEGGVPRCVAEMGTCCGARVQRRKLDLDNYTVSVIEEDDSVAVSLTSPDAAKGARGSTGSYPGYEVEISKKDMTVVRSNYIR